MITKKGDITQGTKNILVISTESIFNFGLDFIERACVKGFDTMVILWFR